MESSSSPSRVNWRAIVLFYGLACAISWPIFWWRDMHSVSWAHWNASGVIKGWLPALGPTVGALAALAFFPRTQPFRVTLWGTSWWRSLVFVAVPIVLLTLLGIGTDQPHLTGTWFGLVYVIYALGEEIGWRGFLQGALEPLRPWPRYMLIGILWGTWHFTTFLGGGFVHAALNLLWLYPMWIGASWGLGTTVEKTRSLSAAAMLHLIFNFLNALPPHKSLWLLGISGVIWVFLIRTWNTPASPEKLAEAQ